MADLIYTSLASLDGFIEDEGGKFDWAEPDEEVHAFVNDLERPIGTYLLGRRMYETLAYWETDEPLSGGEVYRDYAGIWRAADKVVYSRSMEEPTTDKTRIEREFDPDAVRELKESAESDLSVGGAGLAAEAFRAGLVDEYRSDPLPRSRRGRASASLPKPPAPGPRAPRGASVRQRRGLPAIRHRKERGISERDGFPHGVPCWVDTWQEDGEAAVGFYRGLFGWDIWETSPPGAERRHWMCEMRGRRVAGIGSPPPVPGHTPVRGTLAWIDDLD